MAAKLEVDILTTVKKVAGAAAVLAFAKDVVDAASRAEQAVGALDAVFKGNASQVKQWASDSGRQLGIASNDYMDLATLIGTQLKNAGTSMEDLAPKTNQLIELGADMAAMFGGTATDAVSAISSALKGELDPIEKYGVSLNQATLQAKAMEMGLGDLYKSGDAATKQQVLLAAIMEQSADALGANAREAETTAGKQARLAAAWEDAKVTIGQSLIPAYQALMDILGDLIPIITPILTMVGELVSWFTKLPGPIKAVTLAVAGFMALKLTGTFASWGEQITGLVTKFGALKSSAGGMSGAFSSLGKNLAIGGAIGLVTYAISGAISEYQRMKGITDQVKAGTESLTAALVESGGAWDENTRKVAEANVTSSEQFQQLVKAGLDYGNTLQVLSGQGGDAVKMQQQFAAAMDSGAISSWDASAGLVQYIGAQSQSATEAQTMADKQLEYQAQQAAANKTISDAVGLVATAAGGYGVLAQETYTAAEATQALGGPLSDVSDGILDVADVVAQAASDTAEYAANNTDLAVAIADVDDSASKADRALQGLNIIIDRISGRNRSAEEAASDFNASLLDMAEAATDAAEAGDLNKKALAKWDVAALTANKTGQDVYKTLDATQTSYADLTAAAYSNTAATKGTTAAQSAARTAADDARSAFVKQATQFGLTETQAGKLADKMGVLEGKKLTDKDFKVLADDAKAQQTVKDVEKAKVKDKSFDVDANTKPATTAIGSVQNSKLAPIWTSLDATTSAATAAINSILYKNYPSIMLGVSLIGSTVNSVLGIINNLTQPRSTSVTVKTNTVKSTANPTGAANSPTPRSLSVAAQAGPLGGSAGLRTTDRNVIIVQGALDPDAVARQINGYTVARSRRVGPVRMGREVLV